VPQAMPTAMPSQGRSSPAARASRYVHKKEHCPVFNTACSPGVVHDNSAAEYDRSAALRLSGDSTRLGSVPIRRNPDSPNLEKYIHRVRKKTAP